MSTQKTYLDWLREGMKKAGKANKGLAQAMKKSESVVSRMLAGERKIHIGDVPAIAGYIEEEPPTNNVNVVSLANKTPIRLGSEQAVPGLIRVVSVIAAGVWREAGVAVAIAERVSASPDPRVAGLQQYACKIEVDGRFAICVPYSEMRAKPTANDIVHVRRTQGDRYEDTLRVIRISHGQVRLDLVNGGKGRAQAIAYPAAKGDDPVEIRGLVVAYHVPVSY